MGTAKSVQHVMGLDGETFPMSVVKEADGSFTMHARGESGHGATMGKALVELRRKLRTQGGRTAIGTRMGGF